MNETICQQGFIARRQVQCKDRPYYLNNKGFIANVFDCSTLCKTKKNIFGNTYDFPFDEDAGNEIVAALNDAYKMGYEKDRFEYR